jgi:general secretion pathway protein D
MEQGKPEEGIRKLDEASAADPTNAEFRADARVHREETVKRLLAVAARQYSAGRYDDAEASYRQVLPIEPNNDRARAGIGLVQRTRRNAPRVVEASEAYRAANLERAYELAQAILADSPDNAEMADLKRRIEERWVKDWMAQPSLRTVYPKPISLEFRDTPVRMVFDFLSRTTGINFIVDRDVRPEQRTSINLNQAPLEEAIDLLLTTTQLNKKILGQNSVLIYPKSADKIREFQDLVVKSFYLANADPKQVQNTIKNLLKARDLVVDEKLNLLIMRDTLETVRLAEKIIALQDLVEPEVMLEVEVLEIQRTRLIEMGISYPDQVSLTPLSASGGTSLTVNDLRRLNSDRVGVGIASTLINLKKQDGDISLLANPRIRVRNHEKAKILIGDKVPVVTTTATATGFLSENIQYIDVGLKLEVEPTVYLRDDVGIRIGLEVSTITSQIRTASGSLAYQLGTRNAATSLRLKDGETQILAGLISADDRRSASKIPGLGDLPILGRLFSSRRSDEQKTEIVLSITPRLVRNIERPDAFAAEFWSGTETNLKIKPVTLTATIPAIGASAQENAPSAAGVTGSQTSPGPAENIMLTWEGPNSTKPGESFQVSLQLKSDVELQGLPIRIDFDPLTLQVDDVTEGDFFKRNKGTTAFAKDVDNARGRVLVSLSRTSGDSVKGQDKVLTLTLRAKTGKDGAIRVVSALPVSSTQTRAVVGLPVPYAVAIGK